MPNELSDEERQKFIDEHKALGETKDVIFNKLMEFEKGQRNPLTDPQSPPEFPPETGNMMAEFMGRTLPRAAVATAGTIGMGMATEGMSIPIQLLGEAAGAGGGDYLFQLLDHAITERPVSPMESVGVGGGTLLTAGVFKGLMRAGGRIGGIPKEFQDRAGKNFFPFWPKEGFNLTIGSPKEEAELQLGRRIFRAIERINRRTTLGRVAKQRILNDAEKQGMRIPLKPIIESLRGHLIPDPTEPSAKLFNNRLSKFITALEKRAMQSKVLPGEVRTPLGTKLRFVDNGLSPVEFDTFMTKELSPKAFTGTGKPHLGMYGDVIRDAQATAKQTMEKMLGPDMVKANEAAHEQLTRREWANKVFGPSKELTIEKRLANLFQPGHKAEQQILKEIGDEAGIDLYNEALRLATKRSFTTDDRQAFQTLNRIFWISGRPQISRGVAKLISPLQKLTGPTGTGISEAVVGYVDGKIKLQDAIDKQKEKSLQAELPEIEIIPSEEEFQKKQEARIKINGNPRKHLTGKMVQGA